MDLNSTHFISYSDINVLNIDLLEDAWGINCDFRDVIELLGQVKAVPGTRLTKRLINKIRRKD